MESVARSSLYPQIITGRKGKNTQCHAHVNRESTSFVIEALQFVVYLLWQTSLCSYSKNAFLFLGDIKAQAKMVSTGNNLQDTCSYFIFKIHSYYFLCRGILVFTQTEGL